MTAADDGGTVPPPPVRPPPVPAPPSPPAGTAELFGTRWPQVLEYADLLSQEAVTWGLIGPRETPRIWDRHIRNSVAAATFVPSKARVIDLGSGAGLPGIPLALARSDLHMTLVESMARRVQFLELARERCGLPGVLIEHARAERATAVADVVVCRAVAPLSRLLPWAHRLTRGRGMLVALKGRTVADEVAQVATALREGSNIRWRPQAMRVHAVTDPDPATVLVATWHTQRDDQQTLLSSKES